MLIFVQVINLQLTNLYLFHLSISAGGLEISGAASTRGRARNGLTPKTRGRETNGIISANRSNGR